MDVNKIKQYAGKEVYLILNNGFRYTARMPDVIEADFEITDKFGEKILISCSMIGFIRAHG